MFLDNEPVIIVEWTCKECKSECEKNVKFSDILFLPIEKWDISEGAKELMILKLCPNCHPLYELAPSRN